MEEWMEMTQEDLEKLLKKAQKEAEEYWESLTPEEREKAEAEREKIVAEDAKKSQEILDSAKKAWEASADSKVYKPKFCPECGAPVSGGKFCTNCGSKLW